MEFLSDECCDSAFADALRDAGHDVLLVGEITPRADDTDVIRLALDQNRVLLTEDKDFGEHVFAGRAQSAGIVFFRYPLAARDATVQRCLKVVREKGEQLHQFFTVIEPGNERFTPLMPRPGS